MTSGPIPLRLIAALLGKQDGDIQTLIEKDGLPAIPINTKNKPVPKVLFTPFLGWLNKRAVNVQMTAEELEQELDRCAQSLASKAKAKKERAASK